MNNSIKVRKLDINHQEKWQYQGIILEKEPDKIIIEAYFNRDDSEFNGMLLKRNDRFIETYLNNRWFNIFQIHDRDDDRLKGWYCNVCFPAEISDTEISYVDLALDLLVFPDGRQLILDEDEFEVLHLNAKTRNMALAALKELQHKFRSIDFDNLPRRII